MQAEGERLLKLLFPDGYPEDWNRNIAFEEYLSKVGTLQTEELAKEPAKLKDERNHIKEQIQELALSNYKIFLETAQCSRSLVGQFATVESRLDSLLEDIPKFEESFKEFLDKTSDTNTMRKLNSLTLTRNAQLLEILELPQLMESFINDGLYEDALELASYVKKLAKKHPDILILKNIENDVEKFWSVMLRKLLLQLRQDLQLPKCLQIVAYLRRMEVFTEAELRLKFLQARNTWLNSCLSAIPKDDAYHHLTKTIEVTRVNLFNIITQYTAIFDDDEHSPLASPKSQFTNQNMIFFSWIMDKISVFLKVLEEDLSRGVPALDMILGQCMYFGLSFSRVGCDFRALMVPIFTKTIKNSFKTSVSKAASNFEKNMERFTFINKIHPSVPWKSKDADPVRPPESLLEFYPLAEYLNQVLTAFNELRTCMPIEVIDTVVSCLEESLFLISKSILALYGAEHQAFSANSKEAFVRFCTCFADDLIPYLQKCVHIVFPPHYVASHLGISVQTLQKDGISIINRNKIIEPIKNLLPTKIEPLLDISRTAAETTSLESNKSLDVPEAPANVDFSSLSLSEVDNKNVDLSVTSSNEISENNDNVIK